MKSLVLFLPLVILAACSRPDANHANGHERPPENGAQFKDREGVALTDVMKKSIGLQTAEVAEAKVSPEFTVELNVMAAPSGTQQTVVSSDSRQASGWLTTSQAALVKTGMPVDLCVAGELSNHFRGTVTRLEKAPYQTSGEFEVTVETETAVEIGTQTSATFKAPAGDPVATVPKSALLKTAEGHFVYALNGERYVRTPVKVGAQSDADVEITDGLYSGDQVVSVGVTPLWLAELQVLRGGKACTCGH